MSFVIARRAVVVAALSLVSAGLASAPAFAHGPSRQKVVEKIEIAAKAGYDGIEPWINELDEYAGKGGSLDDLGARIADGCTSGHGICPCSTRGVHARKGRAPRLAHL